MNLCVETAPNALTTLWEGGAARAVGPGHWHRWLVKPLAGMAWSKAVKGFAAEGPGMDGLVPLLTSSQLFCCPGSPLTPFFASHYWHFLHGCFRPVISQHIASSKHVHLEHHLGDW